MTRIMHLIQEMVCECDEIVSDDPCIQCKLAEELVSATDDLKKVSEQCVALKRENVQVHKTYKRIQEVHEMHIDALNRYWHRGHRDCPCEDGKFPARCESIWLKTRVSGTL